MRTKNENQGVKNSARTFIQGIYQEFCRLMFFTAQKYCSHPIQQESRANLKRHPHKKRSPEIH